MSSNGSAPSPVGATFVPSASATLISALKPNESASNQPEPSGEYMCEWNNCRLMFASARAVYNHVCKYHLLNSSSGSGEAANSFDCLWAGPQSGCDQIRRQKWSMTNHMQEKHCNENAMRQAILLRKQRPSINGPIVASPGTSQTVPTSNASVAGTVINLNKDAALFAIKRHQVVRKDDLMVSFV